MLDDWDVFFFGKIWLVSKKTWRLNPPKNEARWGFPGISMGLRMKMVSATRIPGCASWFKHPKSRKISINNGSWSIPNRGKPPGWMKYVNLRWAPIYNAYSYVGQFMMKPPVLRYFVKPQVVKYLVRKWMGSSPQIIWSVLAPKIHDSVGVYRVYPA